MFYEFSASVDFLLSKNTPFHTFHAGDSSILIMGRQHMAITLKPVFKIEIKQ